MIRIKICGLKEIKHALAAEKAGADAVGFVFAKSVRRISPIQAKKISRSLGPWISKVGVFVNSGNSEILKIAKIGGLDTVQLHGDEPPSQAKKLRASGLKVLKAFRIQNKADLAIIRNYPADAILLDAAVAGNYGGTGQKFDWNLLAHLKLTQPVIISGGLKKESLKDLFRLFTPYGVDVSSGVEKSPGKKDIQLIKDFIVHAKSFI